MSNEFEFNFASVKHYIKSNKRRILKQSRVIVPYFLMYVVIVLVFNYFNISAESVRATFAGKGALLIPIFLGLQIFAALTPLPDLPFIAAGVLFFQPWFSFLIVWAGEWISSLINFFIARKLGRTWVQKHYPTTINWIDKFSGEYGVETIIVGRSFTFVTFDLVAYAAGISSIGFNKFAIASIFGLIPIALNSVLVGTAFAASFDNILLSIVLFGISGVLAISMGFFARKYRIRQKRILAKKA